MKRKTKNSRLMKLAPVALAAFLLFLQPARADFIFHVDQPIHANAGSSGNVFDVLLTNAGVSPVSIASFSFGISAASPAIAFTEANISTAVDAYIFSGDSLAGPVISTSTGQTLTASDFSNSGLGTSIGPGVTFGIGHILFSVGGNAASGPIGITFEAFPSTSLSDPNGGNVPFSTTAGAINVTSVATPEPAPAGLVGGVLMGFAIFALRRRSLSY
jgi:hypothetical protein